MTIKPHYDAQGTFLGFSAWLGAEWSAPAPYKLLMLALRDSGVEPVFIPETTLKRSTWGGFGEQ